MGLSFPLSVMLGWHEDSHTGIGTKGIRTLLSLKPGDDRVVVGTPEVSQCWVLGAPRPPSLYGSQDRRSWCSPSGIIEAQFCSVPWPGFGWLREKTASLLPVGWSGLVWARVTGRTLQGGELTGSLR